MFPPPAGLTIKIKMANILLKTNMPTFSPRRRLYEPEATIPLFHFRGKFGSPKNLYILSRLYKFQYI